MLVVLLGPTGVGKTSLISTLEQNFSWESVTSFITRPPRANEAHKIAVKKTEYEHLLRTNQLFSHVEQFGFSYGTSRRDIEAAFQSTNIWLLDFDLIRYQEVFGGSNHEALIILPESEQQLTAQLVAAGRNDRVEQAMEQLEMFQDPVKLSVLGLASATRIINYENELLHTAAAISDHIRLRSSPAQR